MRRRRVILETIIVYALLKRLLSRISGETDRDESDHLYQLDASVRSHVRVYRADPVAGPSGLLPDIQRILLDGRRIRRVHRAGNEKQDVGRNTVETRRQV